MTTAAFPMALARPNLLRPILVGGAVAGTLDLISAILTVGPGVPRNIAAGLLGTAAIRGGMYAWILGVLLHYFIAFSAAAVYCLASRKLEFLKEHFVVCGLFFGIAVCLVMNLIVMPLSAFHFAGPYQLRGLLQSLITHMLLVGLPIAYSLRRFS